MAQETKERKKGPHDGHKKRMRKRYLEGNGFEGFSDHEILELFLNYVIVQKTTNEIAHDLIKKFGSLEAVFEAEIDELMTINGVGIRTAMFIRMQRELFKIYNQRKLGIKNKKLKLDDIKYMKSRLFQYIDTLYTGATRELCYMICVNVKGRMSEAFLIGEGSSECVIVNQKTLLKEAISRDASRVVLVHNHLTGISLPSNADVENTLRIRDCLEAVNIELVDHFVYTESGCVSILQDVRCKYRK